MARATTEKFEEMTLEFETTGAALPVAQTITSISAANPAVVVVADGTKFTAVTGTITISGLGGGNISSNGTYTIASIAGNNLTVTGLNGTTMSSPAAPLTQANTPGMTGTPNPSASLAWSKICGITSRTVNRTTTMQQTEVPDCTDESLPNAIEKSVQSQEETVSGTGVWAAESHGTMINWWRGGSRKAIRVGNLKAQSGSVLYEYGYAYLTQLNNTAAKGPKVTSDIQIEFDGLPNTVFAP